MQWQTVCCVAILVVQFSCVVLSAEKRHGLADLDNTDVTWQMNTFGIGPVTSDRANYVFNRLKKDDVTKLIDLIKDEKKFAIAHVMLCWIFYSEDKINAESFHGLEVGLSSDVKIVYPNYSAKELHKRWKETYDTRTDSMNHFFDKK